MKLNFSICANRDAAPLTINPRIRKQCFRGLNIQNVEKGKKNFYRFFKLINNNIYLH